MYNHKNKQRRLGHTHFKRQSGAVLAVSLILLLIMTMIGISAMSTTTLQETFSANAQHKATSFQAAESVIKTTWDIPTMGTSMSGVNTLIPASNMFDSNANIAVSTNATIQYCGQIPGSQRTAMNADLSAVIIADQAFDVCGRGSVTLANATSVHIHGAKILGPDFGGSTGTCLQLPAPVIPGFC
jgi:type IV pilus assembly protein PilX